MDNREILQKSIDYIEENLKADISADELSHMSGFSLFHYYRIFQNTIGMPVMQYVTRRKLLNAIYEIGLNNKMIDVALSYGFNTHAGFFKAFRREFDLSPSAYLKKYKAKKPYKINLVKEEHIMITHKKIASILKNWELENEKITNIYYENSGDHNDHTFYIGNDYVIKFSTNLGNLKNHIEISKALHEAGFSAATPLMTKDGSEYLQDGELFCTLTNRVVGNQMNSSKIYYDDYKKSGRYIGEIIGQLHLVLANFSNIAVNDINLLHTIKDWALPKTKEIMKLTDDFCSMYVETIEAVFDKLPRQIIHRDLNPGNIIVNEECFGFIDFDLSERNIRLYDPCYAATAILSESFENNQEKLSQWIEIYKNIIYGYDSIVHLSDEEKTAIPYIVISNQLVCVAWLSEQEKHVDCYNANLEMTEWLIKNKDKLNIE